MKHIFAFLIRVGRIASQVRLAALARSPEIEVGRFCRLSGSARLRATDGGTADIGDGVVIDRYADITVKYGYLVVGPKTYIGQYSVVYCQRKIYIGDNCLIAEHVTIRDQDHNFGAGLITADAGFRTAPIRIGDNVWIGAKTTITKGVGIGDNAVVGANSVVTRDVPPDTVVAGNPAKVVKVIQ